MKPHFSQAPVHVQRQLELARQDVRLTIASGVITVTAVGFWNFVQACRSRGYSVRVDEVPTPCLDRIAAFTGDQLELVSLRRLLAIEVDYESRCVRQLEALAQWASEPSATEEADLARADRLKLEAERALDARADELAGAIEAKRLAAVRSKALEQATRELGQ